MKMVNDGAKYVATLVVKLLSYCRSDLLSCYIGCLYSGESVEEEKKITWSSLPRFLYIITLSDYVYVCQYHNISLVNWIILDYLLTGDLQCN